MEKVAVIAISFWAVEISASLAFEDERESQGKIDFVNSSLNKMLLAVCLPISKTLL